MAYYIEADKFGGVDRAKLKATDFVFSDERSFPVMTSQDVKDAVSSWGRYKGKHSFDDFKSKLTAIAKRKGFSNVLPTKWDIKEANDMARILETGRVYNKKNESLLRQAYRNIRDALKALGDLPDDKEDTSEDNKTIDKNTKEASGFSNSDLMTALQGELADINPRACICDVYPDDTTLIYSVGYWPVSDYYQVTYTIDDTGVASFSAPVEVTRKVTYVATSDGGSSTEQMADQSAMGMGENAVLTSDAVQLVERAVDNNGEVTLKLIAPGWGSSGYYSKEVLQRDGPKVFTKGTHNFIDHPTAIEEKDRPEGTLIKLGSVLTEDAKWFDDYKGFGAGLYAKSKTVPAFAETLNVIAPNIGMSIRASGKARVGEAEGRKGPIIEAITTAKSVDYVTIPGAGGKVLSLMESAKNKSGVVDMADNETIARLNEANTALQAQMAALLKARNQEKARALIEREINKYSTLPNSTRVRLIERLTSNDVPIADSGQIDTVKLQEAITAAVTVESNYLAQLGVGSVRGLGNSKPADLAESNPDKLYEDWAKSLSALD